MSYFEEIMHQSRFLLRGGKGRKEEKRGGLLTILAKSIAIAIAILGEKVLQY